MIKLFDICHGGADMCHGRAAACQKVDGSAADHPRHAGGAHAARNSALAMHLGLPMFYVIFFIAVAASYTRFVTGMYSDLAYFGFQVALARAATETRHTAALQARPFRISCSSQQKGTAARSMSAITME